MTAPRTGMSFIDCKVLVNIPPSALVGSTCSSSWVSVNKSSFENGCNTNFLLTTLYPIFAPLLNSDESKPTLSSASGVK